MSIIFFFVIFTISQKKGNCLSLRFKIILCFFLNPILNIIILLLKKNEKNLNANINNLFLILFGMLRAN